MGNRASHSAPNPSPPPIQEEYKYSVPQPNKGYNDNDQASTPPKNIKPTSPAVMDCNEAAERYGGIVICEYGSNQNKPRQGWVPCSSTKQEEYSYPSQLNTGYNNYGQAPPTPPPQNGKMTSPAVMDCYEAAERYGGIVTSEYGSNLKKPRQDWLPYGSSNY